METIQLKINGMTCGSCVNSVTQVLQAVPGVTKVVVSLEHKRAITMPLLREVLQTSLNC